MLLEAGKVRELGLATQSWLQFGDVEADQRKPSSGSRLLLVEGEPAFELSFWCGSCAFLFQRLAGANQKGSVPALAERLAEGLDRIDDRSSSSSRSSCRRTPTCRCCYRSSRDLFGRTRRATTSLTNSCRRGDRPLLGTAGLHRTPYYRTFETDVVNGTHPAHTGGDGHLYEFVVPMVPPRWNGRDRVDDLAAPLQESDSPTAVAVSTLDVRQPAEKEGQDYCSHWGMTHFLLDGHHKMEAAAREGRSLRLLSLLATRASLATSAQVGRVPALRDQPSRSRMPQ